MSARLNTGRRPHAGTACRLAVVAALALSGSPPVSAGEGAGRRPAEGRIAFTLYTVHGGTLKLTAQFRPLHDFEPFKAELQVEAGGGWRKVAEADIQYPGYAATFRVDDWDDRREVAYRVAHAGSSFYPGVIRRNPIDKPEFVLAAFSCNSPRAAHGGKLSKHDLVGNLLRIKPDLLFFAGDQVYDHSRHLEHWLQFGEDFGEALRSTPTVCLPDDHDVGQANLWGAGGRRCPSRDGQAGGYYMPVEYVKEVERAQTSHLPDPVDPAPVDRGIGVYFTHLNWGGVSFAILEDRKFKSAPLDFNANPGGRADTVLKKSRRRARFAAPEAELLGERQLRFLEDWVVDWRDAEMKCVLSQSPFAQMCNYSGSQEKELHADLDSNGWPRAGRDRALRVIRKGFACHVAGDQHLGGALRHGVDDWRDGPYSFATPAIANFWLRWWEPKQPGANRRPGSPTYTGDFHDGFGNRMTVLAAANPTAQEKATDAGRLSTRAAGFGVVRFDKRARTTTFECWPRNVDVTDPAAEQYPGWPITFKQQDNYAQRDAPRLPTIRLGAPQQVVTVVDDATGEVVSSLRVSGETHQPRVPAAGAYRVAIGEGESRRWLRLTAGGANNPGKALAPPRTTNAN